MRIRIPHLSLAAGALVLLSACGGGSAATSAAPAGSGAAPAANASPAAPTKLKVMVGGLSKQIYLPNMLTQQLGYFKEQNLDVELIDEASGQS
ncbi:MAG TPA: ABC transporter substrate-binding protein, partial [Chloroflexota bacterium]|nr:ABC transporter substrate-binding protein [Chloroflexota bacterium]